MSQHWHGHWTEHSFKPEKLGNWEVKNWFPDHPVQHCVTTKFIADNRGYILKPSDKSKESPYGRYKGTWDLPKKISRSDADKLSATPQCVIDKWRLHKEKHEKACGKNAERAKLKSKMVKKLKKKMKMDKLKSKKMSMGTSMQMDMDSYTDEETRMRMEEEFERMVEMMMEEELEMEREADEDRCRCDDEMEDLH